MSDLSVYLALDAAVLATAYSKLQGNALDSMNPADLMRDIINGKQITGAVPLASAKACLDYLEAEAYKANVLDDQKISPI